MAMWHENIISQLIEENNNRERERERELKKTDKYWKQCNLKYIKKEGVTQREKVWRKKNIKKKK